MADLKKARVLALSGRSPEHPKTVDYNKKNKNKKIIEESIKTVWRPHCSSSESEFDSRDTFHFLIL